MSTRVGLPYGKAPYKGDDWYLNQGESKAIRQRLIARRTGGLITTAQSEFIVTHNITSVVPPQSQLWAIPVQQEYDVRYVRKVKVNVTATDAALTYDVALYVQELTGDRTTLQLIPASKATFSLAATGIKSVSLTSDAKLPSGSLVWAAGNLSAGAAGTPALAMHDMTNGVFLAWAWNVVGIPNSLALGSATSSTQTNFPLISYLSPQLAEAF